jgi:hypothetical protein
MPDVRPAGETPMIPRTVKAWFVATLLTGIASVARAQPPADEPPAPDVLPAPQVVPPRPIYPGFVRSPFESRNVWRLYGTDERGYLRHRVILAPAGAYYMIDGRPYPWVTSYPRAFMPYATD